MTTPTKDQRDPQAATETPAPARAATVGEHAHDPDTDLRDLVRTQDEVTSQAWRIVAGRAVAHTGDAPVGERADRLVAATRADLLAELREQEQEARQRLAEAGRHGEDAVAAVVHGVTAVVRSVVPPALVRPEDLVEAAYGLADQGLRVARRLALSTVAGLRGLDTAA